MVSVSIEQQDVYYVCTDDVRTLHTLRIGQLLQTHAYAYVHTSSASIVKLKKKILFLKHQRGVDARIRICAHTSSASILKLIYIYIDTSSASILKLKYIYIVFEASEWMEWTHAYVYSTSAYVLIPGNLQNFFLKKIFFEKKIRGHDRAHA